MNKRPKCALPDCSNGGMFMFANKLICGECLTTYQKAVEENQWERLKNATSISSGN